MHFAVSKDQGKTWSKFYSAGYQDHCPHVARLSNGAIVLTYRAFTDDLTALNQAVPDCAFHMMREKLAKDHI